MTLWLLAIGTRTLTDRYANPEQRSQHDSQARDKHLMLITAYDRYEKRFPIDVRMRCCRLISSGFSWAEDNFSFLGQTGKFPSVQRSVIWQFVGSFHRFGYGWSCVLSGMVLGLCFRYVYVGGSRIFSVFVRKDEFYLWFILFFRVGFGLAVLGFVVRFHLCSLRIVSVVIRGVLCCFVKLRFRRKVLRLEELVVRHDEVTDRYWYNRNYAGRYEW